MNNPDEQAERIKENVRDAEDRGGFRSYAEFEAAFEDRDPFEFM